MALSLDPHSFTQNETSDVDYSDTEGCISYQVCCSEGEKQERYEGRMEVSSLPKEKCDIGLQNVFLCLCVLVWKVKENKIY